MREKFCESPRQLRLFTVEPDDNADLEERVCSCFRIEIR